MTARDLQQPLGGHGLGQQVVAHGRRLGAIAVQLPARGDAADRNDAREATAAKLVLRMMVARRAFAPIVGGRLDLLGRAALAGAGKLRDHGLEQRATIGLDRQHIVAAAIEHRLGRGAMAMQRIGMLGGTDPLQIFQPVGAADGKRGKRSQTPRPAEGRRVFTARL